MKILRKTILVTFGLFGALALIGCDSSEAPTRNPHVAGSESPVGRKLKGATWCAPHQVNGKGQVRVVKFNFNDDFYLQSRHLLQADGSLLLESKGTGSWAVLNDQVFLIHEGVTENKQVSSVKRPSDEANCLHLDSSGSSLQLCPCQL